MNRWEEHIRPAVTVDNVILAKKDGCYVLLLIKRRNEPFASHWALPGGFILEQEPPVAAAKRKLNSEANLYDIPLIPIGVFGDTNRDPRGWFISIAFFSLVDRDIVNACAGDDAAEAIWFDLCWKKENGFVYLSLTHDKEILHSVLREKSETTDYGIRREFEIIDNKDLAFDHAKIIATAVSKLECKN